MITLREEIRRFPDAAPVLETASSAVVGTAPRNNAFLLKMQVCFDDAECGRMLAELPGAFAVRYRFADPADHFDRISQHYPAHPMPDGTIPVIEAEIFLHDEAHPDWKSIRAGFARSLVPPGPHELDVYTDGIRLHLLLDGRLMDENFIYGRIVWTPESVLTVDSSIVRAAKFFTPCPAPDITVEHRTVPDSIQYFSTGGVNSWVGDVVPFVHDGTVHLFYLHDRRHHGSKWGTGAHYYGQYSSTDLIHWTEQEYIGTIESQNETCGTGTPFFHNGKYYFAYGLHTTRYVPWETTASKLIREDFEKTGKIHAIPFADLGGHHPSGMTYAVSDDCRHFVKSHEVTHFAENPSVYTMPDNTLRMYANGIWSAEKVNGEWTQVSSDFPPHSKTAPMRNSLECPSFFEWNGHYYLIVGLCGCYSSATPGFEEYDDMALDGRDVYDGLVVPMVIPWKDNRRLICGWVAPFGTCFVWRELVQLPDHQLGIRWAPEFIPRAKSANRLPEPCRSGEPAVLAGVQTDFCGCSMTVDGSKGGKIALKIIPETGNACELQIDLDEKWAQFEETEPGRKNEFAKPLPLIREVMEEWRDKITCFRDLPWNVQRKCHFSSKDFRIDKLRGTDGKFELKLVFKYEKKYPATLIDAEIAGLRTMVSFRGGFRVKTVMLMTSGGAHAENIVRQEF